MTKTPNSSLTTLFIVVFTELIGFGLIIPVLPQLAAKYQLNYFSIGILMSAFSAAQFIAAPILGHLSDKFGRKKILALSKAGSVLAYLVLAISQSYWMFLAARLLDGFTGGNIAVARAYISDVTTKKNRARGMALIGISFGLGFIIGPALGGFLHNETNGQLITSLVAASLSAIAFIMTIVFLKEPEQKTPYTTTHFNLIEKLKNIKQPILLLIFAVYFLYMMVFSGFETTFVMFTDAIFKLNTQQNSLLFMYAGLVGLVVQAGLSKKASHNHIKFTFIGFTILGLGFLGLSQAVSLAHLMLFMGFFSIGIALINTFLPALVSSLATTHNKGFIMGIYESIGSLSRIVGPLAAYSISINHIRTEYFGFFCIIAISLGLLIYIRNLLKASTT